MPNPFWRIPTSWRVWPSNVKVHDTRALWSPSRIARSLGSTSMRISWRMLVSKTRSPSRYCRGLRSGSPASGSVGWELPHEATSHANIPKLANVRLICGCSCHRCRTRPQRTRVAFAAVVRVPGGLHADTAAGLGALQLAVRAFSLRAQRLISTAAVPALAAVRRIEVQIDARTVTRGLPGRAAAGPFHAGVALYAADPATAAVVRIGPEVRAAAHGAEHVIAARRAGLAVDVVAFAGHAGARDALGIGPALRFAVAAVLVVDLGAHTLPVAVDQVRVRARQTHAAPTGRKTARASVAAPAAVERIVLEIEAALAARRRAAGPAGAVALDADLLRAARVSTGAAVRLVEREIRAEVADLEIHDHLAARLVRARVAALVGVRVAVAVAVPVRIDVAVGVSVRVVGRRIGALGARSQSQHQDTRPPSQRQGHDAGMLGPCRPFLQSPSVRENRRCPALAHIRTAPGDRAPTAATAALSDGR